MPLDFDTTLRNLASGKSTLGNVKKAFRGIRDCALKAVQHRGLDLCFTTPELQADREVVLTAVTQNGSALQFASQLLRQDRELVLAAVTQNGSALQFASQLLRQDCELVLAAVTQNGSALQFASQLLRQDRELVLAAVRNAGDALEFALPALKADPIIAMTAIRQSVFGNAMQFVSSELQKNRAVILLASDFDGALEFASPELCAERTFVLAILKRRRQFDFVDVKFISPRLLADREVASAMVRCSLKAMHTVPVDLRADRSFVIQAINSHVVTRISELAEYDGPRGFGAHWHTRVELFSEALTREVEVVMQPLAPDIPLTADAISELADEMKETADAISDLEDLSEREKHREHYQRMSDLGKQVAMNNLTLSDLRMQLARKNQELSHKHKELAVKDDEVAGLRAKVDRLEGSGTEPRRTKGLKREHDEVADTAQTETVDLNASQEWHPDKATIVGVLFHGINSDGDPLTTSKFLDLMQRAVATDVKVEHEDSIEEDEIPLPYDLEVSVDEIVHSQQSVSSRFSCGRTFYELTQALVQEQINPLHAKFLKLDVVSWPGRNGFISIDNRRLLCLKEAQDTVRGSRTLRVNVTVWPLPKSFADLMERHPNYMRFLRHFDPRDNGVTIAVRGRHSSIFRWPSLAS